MNFHIMTLFPEMIQNTMSHSIIGRAQQQGLININCVDIRDFSKNKHKKVDDYIYGGGAGMLIQPEQVYLTYEYIIEKMKQSKKENYKKPRVVYMTPQGRVFNQNIANELSKEEDIIFLCGHYEGIDERVIEEIVTDELSIGDYVLTGGELAVMVVMDSISRLVEGVLNKSTSFEDETFSDNLLEYPQYTRPEIYHDKKVPDVLLSGHHENIKKWKREQSIIRTINKRPELLQNANLTLEDKKIIEQYKSIN